MMEKQFHSTPNWAYQIPPVSLLTAQKTEINENIHQEISNNGERLVSLLRVFDIEARLIGVSRGPAVTRYEIDGVKLNKLKNIADEIAFGLGVSGVRIAAIPNRISTVGIEVPNKNISPVYLREIIESPEFANADGELTVVVGKDVENKAVLEDLAKLKHMLIAGMAGSGKSMYLHSMIVGLLYKYTPDEVRFILIDPKMTDFHEYIDIPHLLAPVVTGAKEAVGTLQWAMEEMMRRYHLFSKTTARDIKGYNKIMQETKDEILPRIIVVIDELADLMMIAAKEVEEAICRIAQMGRAAGIHLVIATQSPRADVITGLIRVNIPSRISLKVDSSLESRIILDAGRAADKLIDNSDMLYAPIDCTEPIRIQGTRVSNEEREAIVSFIKNQGKAQYSDEVISQIEQATADRSFSGES